MKSKTSLDVRWQRSMDMQAHRLKKTKYKNIQADYATTQRLLDAENAQYQESLVPRRIKRLGSVLGEFEVFVRSITTMVQGGGEIAMFVWGAIQAVLDIASKFSKLLDGIANMLEDMSELMPQLAAYSALFPSNKVLDICIEALINDYVAFCVEAIVFFSRSPMYSVLRILWFSLERQFRKHQSSIAQHLKHFSASQTLAVEQELVMSNRALIDGQKRMECLLPLDINRMEELPSLWLVPFKQNPRFLDRELDRESVLPLIHKRLRGKQASTDGPSRQRSCLIHGGGGMGKTQVAIEYAYHHREDYEYVIWIASESESDLANSFVAFAKRLGISKVQDGSSRASIEAARTWLERTGRTWLLVFDNVNAWNDIKGYWPNCPTGSILVTSQFAELGQVTSSEVNLLPLSDTEGAGLLIAQVNGDVNSDDDMQHARRISRTLGGLPLAIVHVAGYIRQSRIDLPMFVGLFEKRQNSARIFNMDGTLIHNDKSLRIVHDIALQELDESSLQLARIMAMLSPEGIPEEMLSVENADSFPRFLKNDGSTHTRDMIRKLTARHLIETQGRGKDQQLLIHRSLQLNLLHRLDEDRVEFQSTFDTAVNLTRHMFPRQSPIQFAQNNLWGRCEKYSPHVISIMNVFAASEKPPNCSMTYALLLSDVSNYLYERNIFDDALRASVAAESAAARFSGSNEAIRADIHTIAGAVRDTCGISMRSKTLYQYEMAIALRQQQLEKTDPENITVEDMWNYANAWGNMTPILLDYECYEDVVLYADLAIGIKRRLLGSGKEFIFAAYEQTRNKHVALAALGQHEQALSWEADPENYLEDPAYVALMIRYYFFHANISMVCGNLDAAHETLQMVLRLRTNMFGHSGRSTLDTYYLLGVLELRRKNIDLAEAYLQEALKRPDEWVDECRARAQYQLARVLLLKGEDAEARKLLTKASRVRAQYWKDHAGYWPSEIPIPNEDAMYDHIVPAEAGRPAMKALLPSSSITPELNRAGRQLQERLGVSEAMGTHQELAILMKIGRPLAVSNQVNINGPFSGY